MAIENIHLFTDQEQQILDQASVISKQLAAIADQQDLTNRFPDEELSQMAQAGLKGMAIAHEYAGSELSPLAQAHVFATLAEGSLATAFVLSQHQGATVLIAASPHAAVKEQWLPKLANGQAHGTNGFNFLNLPPERAPMHAEVVAGGYRLTGSLPWVTAAHHTDILAAGAVLPDGSQILVALPLAEAVARQDGTISIDAPMQLVALTASDTTSIQCHNYFVREDELLAGPGPQLMKASGRGATAFVPTALALGHVRSSLNIVTNAAAIKGGTASEMQQWLTAEWQRLDADITMATQQQRFDDAPILRGRANALAARAAHFALITGGGTGYRVDHTPQRLYREAGFFSVWSASGLIIPETLSHLMPQLL